MMKSGKIYLLMVCTLIGAGLFAAEEPPTKAKENHPKFRRMGKRPDPTQIMNLSETEKKAIEEADASLKAAAEKIRKNAMDEAQKSAAATFDAKLKVYKEAAARISTEDGKKRAARIIEMMEKNREKMIERMAARALSPNQGMKPRPWGKRPMPPRPGDVPAEK